MKKIILVIAIFASILCGCSSSGNDTSTNSIVYDIEMTVKIGDVEKNILMFIHTIIMNLTNFPMPHQLLIIMEISFTLIMVIYMVLIILVI